MTRLRLKFNQYKSNVKLHGEGRHTFKQEKLIEHFFSCSQNWIHEDIIVEISDHCDPKSQRELLDFPSGHLASKRFKSKTRLKMLNKLVHCF